MKNISKTISILSVLAILMGIIAPFGASAQILRQREETFRAKYQQDRQKYLREINFYKSARQNLQAAKTKYQQFKNKKNKKALEDASRNYLSKAINSLIKRLEIIKNWVNNRNALPEAEKQEIINEIDQDITWLNNNLSNVQNASPEAIKEKAKKIRQYWKTHRVRVKRIIGEIWAARINFVIGKAENISTKIADKIKELKTEGEDVSQLESWLTDFNEKISLAKEKYAAAKSKFQEIKGEPGFDPSTELNQAGQLFQQGHQFIKEANQYIKQAHTQLIQIAKEMKKMRQAKTPSTGTEATSAE